MLRFRPLSQKFSEILRFEKFEITKFGLDQTFTDKNCHCSLNSFIYRAHLLDLVPYKIMFCNLGSIINFEKKTLILVPPLKGVGVFRHIYIENGQINCFYSYFQERV